MKKRLLFVDDDANILDGFRRVFHSQRDKWEMHFANSGAQALQLMETQPVDVVITDISMHVMNGIQLLENVMERYPGTIRMILSGSAESDLVIKSVAVTHQYLSKPCDPEILKSAIAQTDEPGTFLQNENLKQLVAKLGALPSVPALFREISKELRSPEPSICKVGEIISQDPGMAAKVLQLANSAFFGRRHGISKITRAVSYLGMERVAQLLLAIHAFAQFEQGVSAAFSIEQLWLHSNATAIRAKMIAAEQHAAEHTADDAFAAGLLHDIGKLILANRLPEEYKLAISKAIADQVPLWVSEQTTFSSTHAEVAGYLLAIWGLPNPIVDATAYHHNPIAINSRGFCALTAVHAADTYENLSGNSTI